MSKIVPNYKYTPTATRPSVFVGPHSDNVICDPETKTVTYAKNLAPTFAQGDLLFVPVPPDSEDRTAAAKLLGDRAIVERAEILGTMATSHPHSALGAALVHVPAGVAEGMFTTSPFVIAVMRTSARTCIAHAGTHWAHQIQCEGAVYLVIRHHEITDEEIRAALD